MARRLMRIKENKGGRMPGPRRALSSYFDPAATTMSARTER
jgi:hypothetical protein